MTYLLTYMDQIDKLITKYISKPRKVITKIRWRQQFSLCRSRL